MDETLETLEILIETVELDNGQTLTIEDRSKKIGEDAYQVAVEARIAVAVEAALFPAGALGEISMDDLRKKVGDPVVFEYRTERNFIMAPDKADVVKSLVDTFKASLLPYLSKPDFPAKFVLKEYRKM
ncbi:MAG: hypothetical protein JEZ12_09520 [Desulfobacterium sp.]|nr:hypothetical protein [Desulfobacterium sp.]